MKILFRADASVDLGSGHVMRCLTLAEELARRGHQAAFACRAGVGDMLKFISARGFPSFSLDEGIEQPDETGRILETWGDADWLVVDHYGLDAKWEKALRPGLKHVLAIDDLADRRHDCDLLLDQNLYDHPTERYQGLLPEDCRQLLGPAYALLRPDFSVMRPLRAEHGGAVKNLLVSFGGSDPTDETGKTLEALALLPVQFEGVDVVMGASCPRRDEVQARFGGLPGLRFHIQADNMAELMARADLAVGGGGVSVWERCCVGLPALCVAVAQNQVEIAKAAHRSGVLHYLGWHADVSAADLAAALLEWSRAPGRLAEMSRRARQLVDGRGAARVCDAMEALA